MSEGKKLQIFIILLLFTAMGMAVFSVYNAQAQAAGVIGTVRIIACGNNFVDPGEECDRDKLADQTCEGLGYGGGTLSCDAACDFDISGCTTAEEPPPGGGGGGPSIIKTKVIFQGKAYPDSLITVLKDGRITGVVKADSKADFKTEITDITAGVYTFGLWAEDKNGIKSITYTLTFRVSKNTITTVSGIFLPPTIDINKTALERGETLNIFGQTVPEIKVDVYILSSEIVEKVQTDEIGVWSLAFNTQPLEEGIHITKARFQLSDEERSGFSRLLSFYVGKGVLPEKTYPDVDSNKDGKVNLIDFSILLYSWGKANLSVDYNKDGIVDLSDFSIMLYYWTG